LFANEEFIFFRPVFNFADAAISVGVVCILIFQTTFLKEDDFFRKDA
jgi:signal peptidase II